MLRNKFYNEISSNCSIISTKDTSFKHWNFETWLLLKTQNWSIDY